MAAFLDKDFLLDTPQARCLFHDVAAGLPIIDYHSHLPPADIAMRRRFSDLADLWLGGDHYKWRLMRSFGIDEEYITGARSNEEKFRAFCKILPYAIGNPIHHWSHLELRRLFGIDLLINEQNAGEIWAEANARLATMDTWDFLSAANVEIACTTDDPADTLAEHAALARSALHTRVIPAYRPDKAMSINAADFPAYLDRLGTAAGIVINSFASLVAALRERVGYFHGMGSRIADHSILFPLPCVLPTLTEVQVIFAKRMQGEVLSDEEIGSYHAALLHGLGQTYAQHGWAMCLHAGTLMSVNRRMVARLGIATGFDSTADAQFACGIATLLNTLDETEQLPKTMLFCLNPAMNSIFATMIGNFQEGPVRGKIQFGPAWWFNDHKEGNLEQLITLSSLGALGTFVGMVTDSRSFASYPRHEYFRRLLCRLIGRWINDGEYPEDIKTASCVVRDVCYENAKRYFAM